MDWLTFSSKLVSALAWPAVACFALSRYEPGLNALLARMTRLKALGIEGEFRSGLDRIEEASLEPAKITAAEPSPVAIVKDGWHRVDGVLIRIIEETGVVQVRLGSWVGAGAEALLKIGAPQSEVTILWELARLRYLASTDDYLVATDNAKRLTRRDALRFVELSDAFIRRVAGYEEAWKGKSQAIT